MFLFIGANRSALPEQHDPTRVGANGFHNMREIAMPWPHIYDRARTPPVAHGSPKSRYLVIRQEEVWFIHFAGEEYGPYVTEREAMLFAIDAAHKLGEQGEETQVLVTDENGDVRPVWTHGHDLYPPRL
jgi:hypothetical protein